MYYAHDGSAAWWWMLPMMIIALVVVGVIVWAILNASRPPLPPAPPGAQSPTPEDVLAHRFARGEIDTAEYHERLEALRRRPES